MLRMGRDQASDAPGQSGEKVAKKWRKKRCRKWQRLLTLSPQHLVTGELDVHLSVALHERRERPFRLSQNL
jgi:hypothetical protein